MATFGFIAEKKGLKPKVARIGRNYYNAYNDCKIGDKGFFGILARILYCYIFAGKVGVMQFKKMHSLYVDILTAQ